MAGSTNVRLPWRSVGCHCVSRTAEAHEPAIGRALSVNHRCATREVKPAAGNIGTTVEVNDLYFSVPARLKFLKSETTEFGHCLEVIRRLALAHSEVVFSVSHNGRVIAYWPMGEPA